MKIARGDGVKEIWRDDETGIELTKHCFEDKRYLTASCIPDPSNLLQMHYRGAMLWR